jgi:hypothetical protein
MWRKNVESQVSTNDLTPINLVKTHKVAALLIILWFMWLASGGTLMGLGPTHAPNGYFGLLTDGFLHGHTHLNLMPDPKLLKLPDPYNPVANQGLRLHDASLYHGVYYLYFSPLTTLIIELPFKILTGLYFSEKMICVLASFASVWIMSNTLRMMIKSRQESAKSRRVIIVCCAVLSGIPYFLGRIAVYETAISVGFLFLSLAIHKYVEIRIKLSGTNLRKLMWMSAYSSLAIFARPNLAPFCLLLLFHSILVSRKAKKIEFVRAGWAFVPLTATFIGMLVYNYVRYHSFTEFGEKYILAGTEQLHHSVFSLSNVLPNIFFYLTTLPIVNLSFPFFHYQAAGNLGWNQLHPVSSEPFLGILGNPILIIGLPITLFAIFNKQSIFSISEKNIRRMIVLGATLTMLTDSTIELTSARYGMEFFPQLILVVLSVVLSDEFTSSKFKEISKSKLTSDQNQLSGNWAERTLSSLISQFLYLSILIQFMCSFEGYTGQLQANSPHLFDTIKTIFEFPINLIMTIFRV